MELIGVRTGGEECEARAKDWLVLIAGGPDVWRLLHSFCISVKDVLFSEGNGSYTPWTKALASE